jgi:hypothetical protein
MTLHPDAFYDLAHHAAPLCPSPLIDVAGHAIAHPHATPARLIWLADILRGIAADHSAGPCSARAIDTRRLADLLTVHTGGATTA